jgi:hypothetical protein
MGLWASHSWQKDTFHSCNVPRNDKRCQAISHQYDLPIDLIYFSDTPLTGNECVILQIKGGDGR